MSFIDDMGVLFLAKGHVIAEGTDLFFSTKARIPDGAGPYVSLIDTGGLSTVRTQNRAKTSAYERPGAQILVRCTNYLTARNKAYELFYDVISVKNEVLNNVWYLEIRPQQNPFDAGVDQQNRAIVIFNVIPVKRP